MRRTMMRLLVALVVLSAIVLPAFPLQNKAGQKVEMVGSGGYCNYTGRPDGIKRDVYAFDSDREAEEVISRIVEKVGLKPNFVLRAWTEDNAAAEIKLSGDQYIRVIYYGREFIRKINRGAGTDWGAFSVMAHEVGHHLHSHTLKGLTAKQVMTSDEQTKRRLEEIEADQFSGYNLCRQGATLDQAQAAMKAMGSEEASPTHPGKRQRLAAIEAGWTNAGCRIGGPTPTPTPLSPTNEYTVPVLHYHGTPIPWSIGVGTPAQRLVQKDTKYGIGSLTISARDKTISYREVSGDLDVKHNFSVPCGDIRNPKIETKTWWQNQRREDAAGLFLKTSRGEYHFLGYRPGQGQNQDHYRYADEMIRKIVEVCDIK